MDRFVKRYIAKDEAEIGDAVYFEHTGDSSNIFVGESYFLATKTLLQEIENIGSYGSVLLNAVFFNFRHYLEFSMKNIIENYGGHFGEAVSVRNHQLMPLYQSVENIATGSGGKTKDLIVLKECCEFFNHFDPNSFSFRYDKDKKGEKIFSELHNKWLSSRKILEDLNSCSIILRGMPGFIDHKFGF